MKVVFVMFVSVTVVEADSDDSELEAVPEFSGAAKVAGVSVF